MLSPVATDAPPVGPTTTSTPVPRPPRPRLSAPWQQPGAWLGGMAVAVLLLGGLHRQPAVLALGGTLALLVAWAWLWAHRAVRGLAIQRAYRDRLFVDEPLTLTWRITRQSRRPLAYGVRLGETCAIQRGPGPLGRLPQVTHSVEVALTFANERGRGRFDIGPGFVEGCDPLGLFRVRRVLPAERRTLRVYPRPFAFEALPFTSPSPLEGGGQRHLHLAGVDLDFSGTREYRPGDNPRRIHWRATAKQRQLILAEFDRAIRTDVSVVLDLSAEARLGTGSHSTSEFAIRIAGTLAAWALGRGHRAQVIAAQENSLASTGLGHGQMHLLRIFDQLAVWRPTGTLPLPEVVRAATRGRLLPSAGTCVLVAPSRMLLLADVATAFAELEQTQVSVTALALQEGQFTALTAAQQMWHSDEETVRQSAGHLVVRGVDVQFVDVVGGRAAAG